MYSIFPKFFRGHDFLKCKGGGGKKGGVKREKWGKGKKIGKTSYWG